MEIFGEIKEEMVDGVWRKFIYYEDVSDCCKPRTGPGNLSTAAPGYAPGPQEDKYLNIIMRMFIDRTLNDITRGTLISNMHIALAQLGELEEGA